MRGFDVFVHVSVNKLLNINPCFQVASLTVGTYCELFLVQNLYSFINWLTIPGVILLTSTYFEKTHYNNMKMYAESDIPMIIHKLTLSFIPFFLIYLFLSNIAINYILRKPSRKLEEGHQSILWCITWTGCLVGAVNKNAKDTTWDLFTDLDFEYQGMYKLFHP